MAANGVDGQLGRYLLGHLSADEEERLEIEYLAGADAFVLVQEAEHDLIDDYVAGRLSADDVRRFEQRLLPRPEMDERVAFARALAAARPPVRRAAARPWLGTAAAAVLAVVSAGLGAGLLQQQRARADAQSRIDALEGMVAAQEQRLRAVPLPRPEAATPAASPRVIELRGGASRGDGNGANEIEEPGAGWLQVRLKMDEHLYRSYKATLERPEGTELAPLPVVASESPVGAEVMVPGTLLRPGTYVIVLKGLNRGKYDLVEGYPFQVRPSRSR